MLDGVRWWKISECIQWAGVIMVLILLMDGVGVEDVDDE